MPKKHKGSTKHSTTRIMVSLFLTILSLFIASCATSDDDDDPVAPSVKYGSLNVEFKTSDIEKILADREKIDVKVTILGDFSGTETKTIEKSKASEPVIFKFPEIKEGSVITVSSEVCETGFKTVIYDGKSASITIVKDTANKAEINLAPCSSLPKIDLNFNTTIKSYSLVKILDVIYLSDKSNANYKDYSVCKDSVISDSVLQLKVKNFTESYTLKLNDKAITVTEGKVALQDILTNTIASKNTIKILKGEETIDTAEYTVETGYYVCPVPALKIVTKEGSSEEVGKSHIIKAGENLRYGVKADTSSKIEFEVVQEDGKAYPAEIKTSFKVENATVDNNLVTINGKAKNTYEVEVSIEVPEEYKKPNAVYSGTVSFTTKYDVDTGFVKSEGSYHDYKLSYSLDGKDYTEFSTASYTPSMYCFDEFGNVYFTYEDNQQGYKKSVKKHSPETKETTEILSPNSCNKIKTISYDFDTSTLYVIYDDYFVTKCGETENTYDLYVYNDEVEGTSAELKKIVVKEGNAYIWYSDYNNNIFNTLYKFTMNISGETIKLENKQSYHFPEKVQSKNKYNVNVNEMVLIDDDIYIAVGMGHDVYSNDEYSNSVKYDSDYGDFESRGCVLKFNTLNNKFNVLGLCEESKTVTTKDWYGFYDDSEVLPPGAQNTTISSEETSQYYKLYLDKDLKNRVTTKLSIETFMPDVEDSKFFGYVTGFAIKPKKLICAQNRNFIYSDTDFDTIKRINACSTVDLHDFVISDYTKGEAADDYKLYFSSCSSLSVDGINSDTELWYDKAGTATKVGNFSGIFSFN